MYDLFNQAPDSVAMQKGICNPKIMNDISMIQGLTYIPNFIDKSEVNSFIDSINSEPWLSDIKRRVQHYGYKYDYKARSIDYSMFIGKLPSWAMTMAQRLFDEKHISELSDQLIINEYEPGQGIANHVDCEPCFGDTIISISLGSSCVMDFINLRTKQKVEVMLESGSLVVLSGEARYNWTHGIAQRKTDNFRGVKTERRLRISMTFRKVILK
ncbi:MAG TPA: alpha-ketoglutarate-dependent dioxygenase AlkB [Chitinophagales bacterium]|mgnify:CR=1 FL=1|nr:alpha-ketoglutarate-dependent dioxygenase AlkB [Chitinophagales bacterium]HQW79856.1 alpha-ketoglutarate-dependent dioxygenase AlkB [Chitinophagales bacterium]